MSGIIKNLVQHRIQKLKSNNFLFFKKLSRIKVLCERGIFSMILLTFSVISVPIKIFSVKKLMQNYISCYKRNQFCAPNRRKEIKKS